MEILGLLAVLLSPLIALQVSDRLQQSRERRQRKVHVFRTLMATRAAALAPDHVQALNVIDVEFYGSEPVGIELPVTVDLTVEETAPGIKGATASAQVKPARLETGLVVQVPPFINIGDKVRVSTETGEYLSRA